MARRRLAEKRAAQGSSRRGRLAAAVGEADAAIGGLLAAAGSTTRSVLAAVGGGFSALVTDRDDCTLPIEVAPLAEAEAALPAEASRSVSRRRVAVLGDGLAGLAAAYHLARAGCAVTLFEAPDAAGEAGGGGYCGALPNTRAVSRLVADMALDTSRVWQPAKRQEVRLVPAEEGRSEAAAEQQLRQRDAPTAAALPRGLLGFLASPLLSVGDKRRALAEPLLWADAARRRRWDSAADAKELQERRRLALAGREEAAAAVDAARSAAEVADHAADEARREADAAQMVFDGAEAEFRALKAEPEPTRAAIPAEAGLNADAEGAAVPSRGGGGAWLPWAADGDGRGEEEELDEQALRRLERQRAKEAREARRAAKRAAEEQLAEVRAARAGVLSDAKALVDGAAAALATAEQGAREAEEAAAGAGAALEAAVAAHGVYVAASDLVGADGSGLNPNERPDAELSAADFLARRFGAGCATALAPAAEARAMAPLAETRADALFPEAWLTSSVGVLRLLEWLGAGSARVDSAGADDAITALHTPWYRRRRASGRRGEFALDGDGSSGELRARLRAALGGERGGVFAGYGVSALVYDAASDAWRVRRKGFDMYMSRGAEFDAVVAACDLSALAELRVEARAALGAPRRVPTVPPPRGAAATVFLALPGGPAAAGLLSGETAFAVAGAGGRARPCVLQRDAAARLWRDDASDTRGAVVVARVGAGAGDAAEVACAALARLLPVSAPPVRVLSVLRASGGGGEEVDAARLAAAASAAQELAADAAPLGVHCAAAHAAHTAAEASGGSASARAAAAVDAVTIAAEACVRALRRRRSEAIWLG